jgi:hypothetical protein
LAGVSDEEAARTAWHLHVALMEWTRSVDTKASFVLALETAVLGGVAALAGSDRALDRISGPVPVVCLGLGGALVAAATLAAILAVIPRHAGDGTDPSPGEEEFIFYGHLRHWSPERLERRLAETGPLPALSRELVTMSAIVWTKHRRVQQSLGLVAAGGALICLAIAFG